MRDTIIEILKSKGVEAGANVADSAGRAAIADAIMDAIGERLIIVAERGGVCVDVIIEGIGSVEFERLDWDCIGVGEPIQLSDAARCILPHDIIDEVDQHNRSLPLPR